MDSWLLKMLAFVAVVSAIFQALSGSGRAEQAFSVSGRPAPALSGSGRAEQAFSFSGRAAPALSGSGRAEQAFSFSGRAALALSGSGNRRLLMTDYSKPTDAPAPAPAHSPNNPICISCCPQKTLLLFTVINGIFGWGLALYLGAGIVYFIYCSYLSFKDLPNLPRVRVYSHLDEGDIERLQNRAVAEGHDRPTEEQLRALKRVRTQLDEHMDKHNTGALVFVTRGEVATCSRRLRYAYEYCVSWMIPIGKPFLVCCLALKFSWPVFEIMGAHT